MGLINKAVELITGNRIKQIERFVENPNQVQKEVFLDILNKAGGTVYGKKYGFSEIKNFNDFQKNVPLVTYETFAPYIERARKGEENVIWKGKIKWFAKSSGTTNAKSKFIPISHESLQKCHYAAGKMMFAQYLKINPDTNLFSKKNLRIGGSSEIYKDGNTLFGDLSAILIDNLPFWAEMKNTPNKEISLMSEWETKMKAIANAVIKEDVASLTGVPSWMLVLLNYVREITGKEYLDDIWPNIEVFFHGGISFKPYEENYRNLTRKKLNFIEVYNASEGYFGMQDQMDSKDLLLLLDNGVYYEFIPMDEFNEEISKTIPLSEVKIGKNYALVISTNGGLWRYIIGDTIKFVSTSPYRFIISGRTKHYINAFGEELIIDNAEDGLKKACEETGAIIKEYTAGPIFMDGNEKGAHQWIIEFEKQPDSAEKFAEVLDKTLQTLNSDYEAKRYKNITLNPLKLDLAREGLFYDWMKQRGKLGGQNKVPRLSNNREYLDPLLELNK